ncbi:hypothetical protein [Actinoplanes sp. N902-109]|uniref:hypothetical protein n=1 Tax=Actinoplanes sp. (strain N902-109) TaxID=649831 RepID=UPI0003293C8E|nr:hypothetical protein [Actinoplanes sp. N902-109]AGL21047.1 hypothetical protein L083_7537 [Actinoplanes sp. N902-109]
MTSETESEGNRPNEHGFSGGATAPEPRPDREPGEQVDGEAIAVPAGDITGAVSEAIEEATDRNR